MQAPGKMKREPEITEAWDRYWRDGRGAACQADPTGRYHGIVASTWQRIFSALPPGCRILDLATGNGAVPALAVDTLSAGQLPCRFHGTDTAAIRPALSRYPREGIECRWHPRTDNASLPFAAGMFDGVVSQYGAEYGDLEASIGEAVRVLRDDGWLHWVCHWRDGALAVDAADEAGRAARLRALELPARIASLVKRQQHGGKYISDSHRRTWHLPEAVRVKQGLAEGFRLADAAPGKPRGNLGLFLHNLGHLYQHREAHSVAEMLDRMTECDEELRVHQHRLEALVDAAVDDSRLARIRNALAHHGFELRGAEKLEEPATGRVVGIHLHAEPAEQVRSTGATPDPSAAVRDARHWSEYWREGAETTFGEGRFASGYDDEIRGFWQAAVRALPDRARIVELGAGNGAVSRMIAETGGKLQRRWHITALDLAEIADPASDSAPPGTILEMRGHTPMEATGLADDSVDLVCGNFALEYGRAPETVAEIARVLRSGGQLKAVMHHPESSVVRQARVNREAISELLEKHRLDREIARMIRAPEAAMDLRRRLEALADGSGPAGDYPARIVRHFLDAADSSTGTISERLDFVERFSAALRAYRLRMADMQQATLDAAAFSALCALLRDAGFDEPFDDVLRGRDDSLLGRTLFAVRQ